MFDSAYLFFGENNARATRKTRKHIPCFGQNLSGRAGAVTGISAKLAFDLRALCVLDVSNFQKAVHEQAQPTLSWDTAGARMRSINQAERFEVRHNISHR